MEPRSIFSRSMPATARTASAPAGAIRFNTFARSGRSFMSYVARHLAYGSTIVLAGLAFAASADITGSDRVDGKPPTVSTATRAQAGLTDAQMAEASARLDL